MFLCLFPISNEYTLILNDNFKMLVTPNDLCQSINMRRIYTYCIIIHIVCKCSFFHVTDDKEKIDDDKVNESTDLHLNIYLIVDQNAIAYTEATPTDKPFSEVIKRNIDKIQNIAVSHFVLKCRIKGNLCSWIFKFTEWHRIVHITVLWLEWLERKQVCFQYCS